MNNDGMVTLVEFGEYALRIPEQFYNIAVPILIAAGILFTLMFLFLLFNFFRMWFSVGAEQKRMNKQFNNRNTYYNSDIATRRGRR